MTYSNFTTFTTAGAFATATGSAAASDRARNHCIRTKRSAPKLRLLDLVKHLFAQTARQS